MANYSLDIDRYNPPTYGETDRAYALCMGLWAAGTILACSKICPKIINRFLNGKNITRTQQSKNKIKGKKTPAIKRVDLVARIVCFIYSAAIFLHIFKNKPKFHSLIDAFVLMTLTAHTTCRLASWLLSLTTNQKSNKQIEELKGKIRELNDEKRKIEAEKNEIKSTLQKKTDANGRLITKVTELENESERLKNENTEKTNKLNDLLEKTIPEKENLATANEKQIERLKGTSKRLTDELILLKREKKELVTANKKHKQLKTKLNTTIASLTNEKEKIRKIAQNSFSQINEQKEKELKEAQKKHDDQIDKLKLKNEQQKTNLISKMEMEMENRENKIAELIGKIKTMKASVKKGKAILLQSYKKSQQTINKHEKTILELTTKNEIIEFSKNRLEQKPDDEITTEDKPTIEAQLKLKNEVKQLKIKNEKNTKQIIEQRKIISEMKKKNVTKSLIINDKTKENETLTKKITRTKNMYESLKAKIKVIRLQNEQNLPSTKSTQSPRNRLHFRGTSIVPETIKNKEQIEELKKQNSNNTSLKVPKLNFRSKSAPKSPSFKKRETGSEIYRKMALLRQKQNKKLQKQNKKRKQPSLLNTSNSTNLNNFAENPLTRPVPQGEKTPRSKSAPRSPIGIYKRTKKVGKTIANPMGKKRKKKQKQPSLLNTSNQPSSLPQKGNNSNNNATTTTPQKRKEEQRLRSESNKLSPESQKLKEERKEVEEILNNTIVGTNNSPLPSPDAKNITKNETSREEEQGN